MELSTIDHVREALEPLVKASYPDATLEVTGPQFKVRFDTMVFTLHRRSMTGRFSEKTYEREGPNNRGFLLTVRWKKGPYETQLVTPQTIRRPYWSSFVNGIEDRSKGTHLAVHFAYGARVKPEFRDQVLAVIGQPRKRR